ncbi:hypothetical protein WN51_06780 [Melipona quadrifasciata]|uniref:Uncharacterized protein n=1 Tax=Melipona quadrifasciata TaxID=166423 RepID=A0A0N0BCS0_9HYME|nr:hypothetical protein WN51_06780 [Melipona quadrifasciata]
MTKFSAYTIHDALNISKQILTQITIYTDSMSITNAIEQRIENLERRMEEIVKLHNRHQEGTRIENKEEKMDIEKNEKEERNTQPWITIRPTKKRENKSKNNQPAEKPGTSKKPPTSSHQPPKHLIFSNKDKPQTQTLVQPQSQTLEQPQPHLHTQPNKNNDSNKQQRKPPSIMLYGNEQITQTISILEKKIKKNFYIKRINNNKKILQTETLEDYKIASETLKLNKIQYFTYTPKTEKHQKILLKHLKGDYDY